MRGKITAIYPEGLSTLYNYVCKGEEEIFNFAVDHRYHFFLLENEGDPVGRDIEYDDVSRGLSFLD